jgi:uncharacterized protein (TIGR02246 family)
MDADEKAIREVIRRWHEATAAGRVEDVLPLMHEDVVFLVAGKPPMRGRAAFEKGLRTLLAGHRIHSSGDVVEVEVAGDLAYTLTRLAISVTPLQGGKANAYAANALSIFRRQPDGRWVMVRDANLIAPS